MDTPQLQNQVNGLQNQVSSYSGKRSYMSFSAKELLSSKKLYIAIPAVILLILLLFRPSFLYYQTNENKKRLSFKKVFIYWILISFTLMLGVFGYNYKLAN